MVNSKIYTGVGDKGQTRLVDGSTVAKHDSRVQAYGDLDELNSTIGLLRAQWPQTLTQNQWPDRFDHLQDTLFVIGSRFACAKAETLSLLPAFAAAEIPTLEAWIDEVDAQLPPLKNFILPGGSSSGALAHLCRTVCRRAERSAAAAFAEDELAAERVYINRLSDFFFVFARWLNQELGIKDRMWNTKAPSLGSEK